MAPQLVTSSSAIRTDIASAPSWMPSSVRAEGLYPNVLDERGDEHGDTLGE
jgi:hypothetical protein